MRIDKLISSMGIATRREIAQNAKRGLVLVDGVPVRDPSRHIDPETNVVSYLGEVLTYREFVYIMLNKPEGYVSATDDPRLPYVLELLPERYRKMGLFPVGRLDRDTTGLMILTNNGPLSHALLSPKHHVQKEYRFCAEHPLSPDAEARFAEGIILDGGELLAFEPIDELLARINKTVNAILRVKEKNASHSALMDALSQIDGIISVSAAKAVGGITDIRLECSTRDGMTSKISELVEQMGGEVVSLRFVSLGIGDVMTLLCSRNAEV